MMMHADDRWAVADLADRYALAVDSADFAQVGELFLPDGVLVVPDPPEQLTAAREVVGREAIVSDLGRLTSFALTVHGLTGRVVDPVDDDHARGRLTGVAHHVATTGRDADDLVWHLRYADRYERRAGRWFIARREVSIDLIERRTVKRACQPGA